jgi:hypothetical protein
MDGESAALLPRLIAAARLRAATTQEALANLKQYTRHKAVESWPTTLSMFGVSLYPSSSSSTRFLESLQTGVTTFRSSTVLRILYQAHGYAARRS